MSLDFQNERCAACSFTGYRPSKLPFLYNRKSEEYLRLYGIIRNEVKAMAEKGVRHFLSGMALGIDLMCANIVLELKKEYDIKLICVIPCAGQCAAWKSGDRREYEYIVSHSDGVVRISDEPYTNSCMMERNRYLVDSAQYLIAVFDGRSGGTKFTVNYARKMRRTIIIIDPGSLVRTELIHGNDEGVIYV